MSPFSSKRTRMRLFSREFVVTLRELGVPAAAAAAFTWNTAKPIDGTSASKTIFVPAPLALTTCAGTVAPVLPFTTVTAVAGVPRLTVASTASRRGIDTGL